jgi:hypothetical protein
MDLHNLALMAAGAIGCAVAVFHGVLTERYLVSPLVRKSREGDKLSVPVTRLIAPLLHYSTASWFFGGAALIVAAGWLSRDSRLALSWLVGAGYLFGIIGNFWAMRRFHPGWALLSCCLALIIYGAD